MEVNLPQYLHYSAAPQAIRAVHLTLLGIIRKRMPHGLLQVSMKSLGSVGCSTCSAALRVRTEQIFAFNAHGLAELALRCLPTCCVTSTWNAHCPGTADTSKALRRPNRSPQVSRPVETLALADGVDNRP